MTDTSAIQSVVVGYDGTADSELGLSWAMATASRYGTSLRVVIVRDPLDNAAWPSVGMPSAGVRTTAEERLDAAGLRDAVVETVSGRPEHRLCALAGTRDLLVVGSHGHSLVGGAVSGSVSRYLVHHAVCPVVVARPVAGAGADQLTVGIDGSDQSLVALGWAAQHARAAGGEVVALFGLRPGLGGDDLPMGEKLARDLEQAERDLHDWVSHAPLLPTPVIKTEVVAVEARELLVDVSKHSAMVVVGAPSHGVIAGVFRGSVMDHVVRHAHCPVVVVR